MSSEKNGSSSFSQEIAEAKDAALKAAATRTRIPQPLFWSLFHTRLSEIKRRRELKRALAEVFDGLKS